MSHLLRRAAVSSLWSVAAQGGQMALGLLSLLVLARWLSPEDYGVLGLSATVTGVIAVLGDIGVISAVVRSEQVTRETQASAFWMALLGGCSLAVMATAAAPLLGWYYRDVRVAWLAVAQAAAFVVATPGRVSTAMLMRDLRFGTLAVTSFLATLAGVLCAWVMAYAGLGAWALVSQTLVTLALQSTLTVLARPYPCHPRLATRTESMRLASFSWRMTGFSLAITFARTGDAVLGGRILGPEAPGYLGLGQKLVQGPINRVAGALSNVFLPTILRVDSDRQGRALGTAVRVTNILVAPVCCGLFALAPEVIAWLPARWAGLTGVLRAVAVGSLVEPVAWLSLAVLMAHGRAGVLLRYGLAMLPLGWMVSLLGAVAGSPLTLSIAWASYGVLAGLVLPLMTWRRLGLSARFWRAVLDPLVLGILAAVVARMTVALLGLEGRRIGLWVGAIAGLAAYGPAAFLAFRADLSRLAEVVRGRRPVEAREAGGPASPDS